MNNKEYQKEWYLKNRSRLKEKERRAKYKRRYGIEYEDFILIVEKQNSLCLICNTQTKLHLDHSHSTGKIRGALCHTCNNGLGCFKDDPIKLQKAKEYLEWFE